MELKSTIISPAWKINEHDVSRWLHNIAVFSAPLVLIFFIQISQGTDIKIAGQVFYVSLINAVIDFLRKWIGTNAYVPETTVEVRI